MNDIILNAVNKFFFDKHKGSTVIIQAIREHFLNIERILKLKLLEDESNIISDDTTSNDEHILDKIKDNGVDSPISSNKSDDEILLTNAPIIYAFITSDVDDAIKIGYTDQGAEKRLSQWRLKYHDVLPLGWWTSMEVNQAKEKVFFKDYPVHDRTIARGYERLVDNDFKNMEMSKGLTNLHVSREFFRKYSNKSESLIDTLSKEIIEDILEEMKKNIRDNNANFTTYTLQADGAVNKASRIMDVPATYSETGLQEEAILNGVDAIKAYREKGDISKPLDMLMSAVMRFGKTHAAYLIIKESGIKYALVTSAKADTRPAWRNDINHINYIDDFCFIEFNGNYDYLVSEKASTADGDRIVTKAVLDKDIIDRKRKEGKTVIVYATLLDLDGKLLKVEDINKTTRVIKDKHLYLYDNPPEIIVIDETHYGSHSETYGASLGLTGDDVLDLKAAKKEAEKAERLISPIKTNIRLQCSGTPYYILASGEFSDNDKVIITKVSFADMLKARDQWKEEHPNEDETKSPYYGIPTIKKFGMKLTKEAEKAALDANLDLSLSELFKNDSTKFAHEDAIIDLFSALFGAHGRRMPGFMNKRQIKEGKLFLHIVICTPSIDSANLLSKLLVEKDIIDQDERKVLLAVERREGGDRAIKAEFEDSDKLNRELSKLDNDGKMSVTITVNRFLTGVSVPLWDSMFMMKDTRSPQEYDQAIFRICTRNVSKAVNKKSGEEIKVNRKENVYLIDFNISRMFKMTIDSAVAECKAKGLSKPSDMRAIIELNMLNIPMFAEESVYDALNGRRVLRGLKSMDVEDLLKRYMEYDLNKSIEDAIDQKLNANVFKNFCSNIDNLDLVMRFEEGGIGKANIKQDTGTTNLILKSLKKSGDEENTETDVKLNVNYGENKEEKGANIKLIIENKFKTLLKGLLYSCICLKNIPEDTDELLEAILEDENSKLIIETFGLDIDTIDDVVNALNSKEKTEINFLLLLLKTLADDEELKSKNPALGFVNAVNKLGRLDNKKSEEKEVALVVTPPELVKKMIDKIPDEKMRNAESILEVNSKTGEFLVEIYNRYGKEVANRVKIVAGDDRCKMFIKKILNLLDLDAYNLLDIEDRDDNGKYDVKDFLKYENEEILEMSKVKGAKFSCALMNPPYSGGLHEKFLYKLLTLSPEYLITVQPDSYMFKGKNGNEKIKNILKFQTSDIENIDANNFFDAGFQNRIAILSVNFNNNPNITFNNKHYDDIDNISMFSDDELLLEFDNHTKSYVNNNNMGKEWKGIEGSHYPDRIEHNPNPQWPVVQAILLRGHVAPQQPDGKADDFYTFISNNTKFISTQGIGYYKDLIKIKDNKGKNKLQYYFVFDSMKIANNFLNYLRGYFARTFLYLYKKDMNVMWHKLPKFDFSDPIFDGSPGEIDDALFKKFNISDEIRKHIEEILPDYYNIRK